MFYYIIVYLFTIMENVNIAVGWVTGLSATTLALSIICYLISKSEEENNRYGEGKTWTPWRELWVKVIKRSAFVFVPILLINIALPSTKEDIATIAVVGYGLNCGAAAVDKLDEFGDSQVGQDLKDIVALQVRGYKNRLENFGSETTPTPEKKVEVVKEVPVKVEKSQVEEAVKDVVDDELIDLIAKKVAQSAKEQLKE